MSKKMMKRSLALGALMAFVITGSAMAAELTSGNTVVQVGEYEVNEDVTISGTAKPMMGYQLLDNPGKNGFVEVNVLDGKKLTVISNNGSTGTDTTGAISNVKITGGIIDIQGKGNAAGLGYGAINEITASSITISSDNSYGVYTGYGDTEKHILSADKITISSGATGVQAAKGSVEIKDFSYLEVTSNTEGAGLLTSSTGTVSVIGTEAVINSTERTAVGALGGTTLNVNVSKLTATASGLGTETGDARKHGAITAEANSIVNLNVKESLVVNVKDSAAGSDVYGIIAGKNGKGAGTVNINAGENANNTADITINVSGDDATGVFARKSDNGTEVSTIVINGKTLTINANVKEDGTVDNSKDGYGIWVANGTDNDASNRTQVTINTESTIINAETGLVNHSEGMLNIANDLTINSTIAIDTRGDAVTNINADGTGTVKIAGDIMFGYSNTSGTKIDASVNINLQGEESYLDGNIYKDLKGIAEDSDKAIVDGMALSLSKGAQWTTDEASFVNNLTLNDGIVNIVNGAEGAVTIDEIVGDGGTFNVDNATANQVVISDKADTSELTVATTNQELALADLIGVVADENGANVADIVEKTGGAVYEKESAAIVDGKLGDVSKVVDAGNLSANDMAAVGLMSWRAEMNDMNKRMGELRNANGDLGVWVRMVRGESEYNSVKNQYNQYQLGYDEKLSVDPSWTVGVALSYTDAQNNFAQGNGESTNKALSFYGSKLNEDGTFVDLIAKYARLENEFDIVSGMGDADYSTNGYSFSAEFGKRIRQGKGLWIEPQVELTYGKVSAVDYVTANGVNVAQDGMESLVGRVGFSLGKDIKDGNVYARASYLYDFEGETQATLNNDAVLKQDLGGGWWEVGVGANINLSKATYIYADVEKTFGGEVDTNWKWNLGVRYSF